MKIIYSGIRKENYNPGRAAGFEHENFYLTLTRMPGVEVVEYPYDPILVIGKKKFNENLLDLIREEKPDLFFAFMFTDEFDFETLDEIKKITASAAWFADDHWRLHNYSRRYVSHFTKAITTWSKAPAIYGEFGITNIIRSQWACNEAIWVPVETSRDIDVSFVGQYNSARGKIVRDLRNAGINVWVRGWGWPDGRLTRDEMVAAFSRSKINLNFNTSPSSWDPKILARIFFRRSRANIVPDFHFADNFRSWRNMNTPQIKARSFEVLGCRTFLISAFADDMDRYYEDGREIVYYDRSTSDLIEKIRYYLPREREREAIAARGYERTLREHTYVKRFTEIFKAIGLR